MVVQQRHQTGWAYQGLLACCFLFVFTETMLSPYYPQFFRRVFANEEMTLTGDYITLCRFVVMLCAPLWGWVARYVAPLKLLIATQLSTAAFTGLCAFSTTTEQFFLISVLLLIGKSSYVLFYTQLINLRPTKKSTTVALTQACFHSAIVASTLMSAWVIQWAQPLRIFFVLAALDVVQVIFCFYLVNKIPSSLAHTEERKHSFTLWHLRYIHFMLIIFLLYFCINVIRPYFTTFMSWKLNIETDFISLSMNYLLPSAMALVLIPFVTYYKNERFFSVMFSVSLFMLMLSLLGQANSENYWSLFLARCVFGAFSILCLAGLDFFIFKHSDSQQVSSNYTAAIAIQNAALLSAPILAGIFVSQGSLIWPFYIAAAGALVVLVLVQFTIQKQHYFASSNQMSGAIS